MSHKHIFGESGLFRQIPYSEMNERPAPQVKVLPPSHSYRDLLRESTRETLAEMEREQRAKPGAKV